MKHASAMRTLRVGVLAPLTLLLAASSLLGSRAAQSAAAEDPTFAQMRSTIAQLQPRIERVEDANQVEKLVSAYGYYLDKQQWDQLADLFAPDGRMEISLRGIYVGKKSIRRALELFGPQNIEPNHLHDHIQLQPVITLSADGTHAYSRSRALSELGTYPVIGLWGDGVYENEYVKRDGVWMILRDHVYTSFFATYEKGWLSGARPAPRESSKIPPDLPPSELYESFPAVYVPPFHFNNPVTGAPIEIPASLQVRPNPKAHEAPAATAATGASAAEQSSSSNETAPAAAGSAGATSSEAAPATFGETPEQRLAALQARLGKAQQGIGRLEDERAIENLQRTYGFLVDKALWKDTADLFADDATLEIGGRGVFVGKARVLQYLKWLAPQGLTRGKLFNHIQLDPIVTVAADGNTARGRWRFLAEVGDYEKSARWGTGTYENEYVKQNGVWKIKSLHGYFRMYTDYTEGWAKSAVPNTHPEKELPPDRPPSVTYEIYPATFIPPPHYPNPVTGH